MVAIVKGAGPMASWLRSFFSDMGCGRFPSSPVLGHYQLMLTMKESWPYPVSDKVTVPVGRLTVKDTCDESLCWLISKLLCCSQLHIKLFKVYVCAHICLHRCRVSRQHPVLFLLGGLTCKCIFLWLLSDFFRLKNFHSCLLPIYCFLLPIFGFNILCLNMKGYLFS